MLLVLLDFDVFIILPNFIIKNIVFRLIIFIIILFLKFLNIEKVIVIDNYKFLKLY